MSKTFQMKVLLGAFLLTSLADCARILAIVPITVKSHFIVMEPLLQALAARGHQLTVVSNFPQKAPSPNYTDIDCSDKMHIYFNDYTYDNVVVDMGNFFKTASHLIDFLIDDCETLFKSSKLDALDIGRKKYDLLITEVFAVNCYVHFAHKLGVPHVSIVTSDPLPWTPDYFGLPDDPSYIPNYFVSFPSEMSFLQRFVNVAVVIYSKLLFNFYGNPKFQEVAENYFQEKLPWVDDVARNSSLLLVNTYFSLGHSRPFPPNVVEVGGIHIKERSPLPKDLQELLDRSPQGVILLSFGSMLQVSTLPEDKMRIMMNVFSRIPQTVLMKYENQLPGAPKNVITRSWLPQRDILEHKNVRAFVTHGGLASIMEAVLCAKPLIGVPFFADQFLNINNIYWKGAGLRVDHKTMTEQSFESVIHQVLNNPQYSENMQRLSLQFRDRPRSALETAVFWVEYVLRHGGAPHLRPASVHMPFYQRLLLDVIAVLLLSVVFVLFSLYTIVKFIVSTVRGRGKQKHAKTRPSKKTD